MHRSFIVSGIAIVALGPTTLEGQAPGEWNYTLDRETVAPVRGEPTPGAWAYQQMPPGWHLTTTDQGVTIYPTARLPMEGEWGVELEVFLFPEPSDEGVGIALMPTAESRYAGELRILFRRDGQVSAGVYTGGDTIVLAPWTTDTGVVAHDGKEIRQYELRVEHRGETLTVSVDGRQRLSLPIGPNEQHPVAGIRAGRGLNLHISRFDLIKPLAPPRPPAGG